MNNLFLLIGAGVFIVLLFIVTLMIGYFKAPTNKCYVISGLCKNARKIIGKSGFMIPFFERRDELTLELISVDVKTSDAVPTSECINISVDAVANIKISTNPDMLNKAAQNFLNRNKEYIENVAREVLEGNLREIVGTMTLKEMMNDRKTFAERVQENAVPDLNKMGLEIVSFNVQNFADGNGVINNLGIDNIATIQKNASIAKANANKEVAVAEAKARKEANDAKVEADQQIAEKQNALEVRKAELEANRLKQVAIAEAAGKIESEVQRKTVEVSKQDAEIARLEKEAELKNQEIAIKEKSLDAEIKKKADAEKYAAQTKADAELYERTKAAEADKIEREREAEANLVTMQKKAEAALYEQEKAAAAAIAKSEAEKTAKENEAAGQKALAEAVKAQGAASAAAELAHGEAIAKSIKLKGEAEAEALMKRAAALKELQESGQMEMQLKTLEVLFNQMPAIAAEVAKPMSQIGNITMYGNGNVQKFAEEVTASSNLLAKGLMDGLGVNLSDFVGNLMTKLSSPAKSDNSMLKQ